jgi:hypothetical protein
MNRLLFLLFFNLVLFNCMDTYGQAKKPTLMVLPSDQWCDSRYFMSEFNNQGSKVKVPNYKQAFQEDNELGLVIAKIGSLMVERGYPLKDVEQEIKILEQRSAEDNMTSSASSGSALAESPLDVLKKHSKADILIQVWWKVNKEPSGKSISYTIQAFDAYTSKQIASSTGTGIPGSDIVPVMLSQVVAAHIDEFLSQLQRYFEGMAEDGREVTLRIRKWGNWSNNLETEFDGKELNEVIENWIAANSVKGRFTTSDATENGMVFEQVRIPLYDATGKAIDARQFARDLQKYLKAPPFTIECKLMSRGLGEAIIVLGEK